MAATRVKWSTIVEVSKCLYTPVALACIVYLFLNNRGVLIGLFSSNRPLLLIYAVLLWAVLQLLAPLTPWLILRTAGYPLSYKESLKIYITRLPARYVPGGVWHTVGRLVDYHAYGVSKKHLSFLTFFETFFPVPVTFLMGGTLLLIYSPGALPRYLDVISIGISVIFLFIPILLLKWSFFRKYSVYNQFFKYLYILFISLVFWFIAGFSFVFYYKSFYFEYFQQSSLCSLIGAYVFSWGVGYISIFSPQGIGVFEIVAGKIINLPMNIGSSVVFLIGFRLVSLTGDLLVYFSFMLDELFFKKKY